MRQLHLNGQWRLRAKSDRATIPARVPGDNYSALIAAGQMADPFRADNERRALWAGRQDWVYERTFSVSQSMLAEKSVFLNCDGLDTVATVFLNGRRVGRTDNMFTRYRFEVRKLLRAGRNVIRIEFASPEKAALAAARRLPYPIPHTNAPVQSPHRNLLRKVQCHGGWDWGPCLMVSGICGDIYLGATSLGRIEYVTTAQRHRRGAVAVDVTTEVISPTGGRTVLEVSLGRETVTRPVTLKAGHNVLHARLMVRQPRLWWPNGYGAQPLYELTVRVAGDETRKRLGLRTLELITREDARGLGLVFRVNGVDVFCKGANWIPTDALPQRQTRRALEDLLASAVQAHMNMLRVWGGGQYETDAFYDLCDEKGLLVWQDFMFSCALYPATPDFLENVRQEVRHQIKRLRDHPCIAVWCGNNENVGALNWFEESRKNRDRYLVDYDRLNEGVIGKAVDECDPTRRFWPSSPCGGRGDYSDGWHQDNRGDMHYWSVWFEDKPFAAYRDVVPRFCSEFGFQSFPSLATIRTCAPPDQFNATAPLMEYHQRSPNGNRRIVETMARYFRVPDGFANFVYVSQVQQALAIKTAVEYWRRRRPTCMGALYWQLNDNWPVCSWSSIEYGGKWKLLHYAAKRFFAPVMATAQQGRDERLEVWVVNDRPYPVEGTLRLQVLDFTGRTLKSKRLPVRVPAGSSRRLGRYRFDESSPAFVHLTLRADGTVFRNEHLFTEYKRCPLAQTKIRTTVRAEGNRFRVTVAARRPAFFVTLNAEGIRGEFDDNCLTLLPGEPRTLVFTPQSSLTVAKLKNVLRVTHLRETYC